MLPPAGTELTPDSWPIATCLLGIPQTTRQGIPLNDADPEDWDEVFEEIASVGFALAEVADSHFRPADLERSRREELLAIAGAHGVGLPSVHVQRKSIIMPGREAEHVAYAHRSIDAAAEMGMGTYSTGLHQPFSPAQVDALWFWTAQGPRDPESAEVWSCAVRGLRELGRHAAEVGMLVSLELYEDTFLGTADSAVRLIEEIDLDNVGLNPDVGNLIRLHRPVEDWSEAYAKTLPHANYWHVKNYARDEAADGSWATSTPSSLEGGLINYRQVLREAVRLGFTGTIVCEHYGGDSLGMCATNQDYIRRVLPRGASVSRPGARGVRVPSPVR